MPLPKPRPTENTNQFINRCMVNDTMVSEYSDRRQRYAVCNSLSKDKSIFTKKLQKKISKDYEKQILLAEKKNYPLAYQYYLKEFKRGTEMFIENSTPNNPRFAALFSEKSTKEMYSAMYIQTGLRFSKWYRNNFVMFEEKQEDLGYIASSSEQSIQRYSDMSTRERQNLENIISQNMQRYALEKDNYLALVKEVSAVSGVARDTLVKVLRELVNDEKFMNVGLEERTRIIMNRLTFKARWMARRIVQTETTASANFGIQETASQIFGDKNLKKQWIAGGSNIRDTHSAASSYYQKQPIPMNQPYYVGSSQLMFPADTKLGALAREVVNCKCVSIPFVPNE